MWGEDKILDPESLNDPESKVLNEDNGGACSSNNVQYSHYNNCRCGRTFTEIATEEDEGVTKLCKSCITEEANFKSTVASSAALVLSSTKSFTSASFSGSPSKYSQDPSSEFLVALSPLTNRSESSSSNQQQPSGVLDVGSLTDDGRYILEDTHLVAVSVKAPNWSANYSAMNLYNSIGVLDSDLELQIQTENEKRVNKLYMGVDVIFKPDGKAYIISYPLMCPARVFYVLNGKEKVEIFVGIIVDGKNGCYPLQAVYDLFGGFKNLFMTKTIVHTYFQRMNPYKVSHEFSDEKLDLFGAQIATYMTLKSPLEEKEGLYIFRSLAVMMNNFILHIYLYLHRGNQTINETIWGSRIKDWRVH